MFACFPSQDLYFQGNMENRPSPAQPQLLPHWGSPARVTRDQGGETQAFPNNLARIQQSIGKTMTLSPFDKRRVKLCAFGTRVWKVNWVHAYSTGSSNVSWSGMDFKGENPLGRGDQVCQRGKAGGVPSRRILKTASSLDRSRVVNNELEVFIFK